MLGTWFGSEWNYLQMYVGVRVSSVGRDGISEFKNRAEPSPIGVRP